MSVIAPLVTLHVTLIWAVSPVDVNPTAMKSATWFGSSVMAWGETTSELTVGVESVTLAGCSQPNSAAAASTAAGSASARNWSGAREPHHSRVSVMAPPSRAFRRANGMCRCRSR